MKKFTKVMLIIAGVLASVGIVCMVVAFAMGLTTDHLGKMIRDGRFSFDEGDLHISYENDWKQDMDDDVNDETHHEDGNVHHIDKVCRNMDVEFGGGILEIYYDDVESIQVKQNNIPKLKVQMKDDTLEISEEAHVDIYVEDDRSLVIVLPEDMQLEAMDLDIGASKASIKDIHAEYFDITVGAGQADITNIVSKEFQLEVGAGQATVKQLDAEIIEIEAGLGQVNVELNDVQEEYNYHIECGVGSVVVGTSSYNGLGATKIVEHDGATKQLDVECGIGEVRIHFTE